MLQAGSRLGVVYIPTVQFGGDWGRRLIGAWEVEDSLEHIEPVSEYESKAGSLTSQCVVKRDKVWACG